MLPLVVSIGLSKALGMEGRHLAVVCQRVGMG
jgi:hypothetical protein